MILNILLSCLTLNRNALKALTIFILIFSSSFYPTAFAEKKNLNKTLLNLPPNKWAQIHEQKTSDLAWFQRQRHGGSCFDAQRGVLILFGSDTHNEDWKNSPFIFNTLTLAWSRDYPDDPVESYAANENGMPVAGKEKNHPWAMHTFGAVVYDSARDEMVVCSHPDHMAPGRFTNALEHVWGKVLSHPTWSYKPGNRQWQPLACDPVSFFANSAAYDTDRSVIVGYRHDGFYELNGNPRRWKKVAEGGFLGWHNNSIYDSKQKKIIVFGSNEDSNEIVVYDPKTQNSYKMPTSGIRPPKDQHNPMEFEPNIGQTVIVIDRQLENKKMQAETWLYDSGNDQWAQIKTATLPFACGMNYNMEYDPSHKVLLLVTGGKDEGNTKVWALKINLN
jgi:hypothetical protein